MDKNFYLLSDCNMNLDVNIMGYKHLVKLDRIS